MAQAIWEKIGRMLSGDEQPPSEEIAQARREVNARIEDVDKRIAAIDGKGTNSEGRPTAPERRRVMEQGTPEDLAALDREVEALRAERSQLGYRSTRLYNALTAAQAREAVADAKNLRKRAENVASRYEAAQAELEAAKNEARNLVTNLDTTKRQANEHGLDEKPLHLPDDLADRVAAAAVRARHERDVPSEQRKLSLKLSGTEHTHRVVGLKGHENKHGVVALNK